MLALSTRRGQCLFCSFRAAFTALPSRYPESHSRSLTSTAKRKNRGPRRASLSIKKFASNPKDTLISRRPLRHVRPDQTGAHVRRSLTALKKQLETTKVSADTDVTQLAALDPLGTYWPAFKEQVQDTLSNPGQAGEAGFDGLIHDIGVAESGDWEVELPRVLHFGFVDYVLMRRAQDTPEEASALEELKFPTEWYTNARQVQRDVHLHIGPTNSGKTYTALKRLEESGDGFYAGPLRLLAHEVYSRFKAKGVSCDLVTGDDVRLEEDPDTRLSASTVEMVDVGKRCEVAVIDEIQMMADQDRGWAWTRAFLGANAKEVHICGETRVLPLVRELTASTGDILHVHEYKRLNPLKVMTKSLRGDLKNLRKGDAIVAFSVMNIHALKKQIELDTGRRCAIVYGSLPPETRAQQAALFNDPNNDYDFLVASDAIGMGLNLSVKRIIFHSVTKFNGTALVNLSTPQIKQIGGRAGRYRNAHQAMNNTSAGSEANVGLVTTLNDEDLPLVRAAMQTEAAPIKRAGVLPPGEAMEEFEGRLPRGIPFEYILRRLCGKAAMHDRFRVCSIRDQTHISRTIESVRGLSLSQRLILTAAPANITSSATQEVLKAFAECVAERRQVTVIDIPEVKLEVLEQPVSGEKTYLERLEDLHKSLVLYLWLSYRFLGTFKDREMAMYAKEMVEERINTCLLEFSANPDLRKRVLSYKKRMTLPQVQTQGESTTDAETELDVPGEDTALPVDWVRGSEQVEFDETPAPQPAVAAHG
ncbi:RNA helicase [Cladophialophora chaetospira]|uniref:ATP-dependent RNA helicase SUV3, mitochondrial n=1 Tax=Cladophialophora chaetospira TaxID=386627 RepID=A0AA39CDJ5_9EURO|nr:RNA helicase [Cladophialophora chaetospira]